MTQPSPAAPDVTDGRSARKHRAIIEAATDAFLQGGYRGTSLDQIAAAAQVSKQTVYKHFADKESLFAAIVTRTVEVASAPVHEQALDLENADDVEAGLRALAVRLLTLVLTPQMMQLRRLVISEAERFPELGRAFHEQGPGRAMADLAASLRRLADRGVLRIDDEAVAASQFNWLVLGEPMNRAMLLGDHRVLTRRERDRIATRAVDSFLAAHRPT